MSADAKLVSREGGGGRERRCCRRPFWMRSLTGQWMALMLAALVLSQVVFLWINRRERAHTVRAVQRDEFLLRTASAARLLDTTPVALHREILRAANTTVGRYWISDTGPGSAAEWQRAAGDQLVAAWEGTGRVADRGAVEVDAALRWEELGPGDWPGERRARMLRLDTWNGFGLALEVRDGLWLNSVYAKPWAKADSPPLYHVWFIVTAVLLSLVSVLAARRVGRPLRRLTESAERLGRGEEVALLPEEGAEDIRRTAAAFNRMQLRIRRFVEDRTQMMAAISHDLRTPITSLRLRAEFVEDAETRERLIATLDEMKAMTEATLAFAREEAAMEPTRTIDLDALLESLCDDLAALGWDVSFSDGGRAPWRCRPDALRRALRNVIENAIRYGDRARVRLVTPAAAGGGEAGEWLEIVVEDDGPGIAVADRERVFAPFVRLEVSRNRSTGGVGLGLAIARTIVRSHGGDILLANRSEGAAQAGGGAAAGLRVTIRLPRD